MILRVAVYGDLFHRSVLLKKKYAPLTLDDRPAKVTV